MIIKIVYGTQIHLYNGQHRLETIQLHCQQVFKHLPDFFDFFYVDDDGDRIALSTDYDFGMFSQIYGSTKVKKIFIREIDNVLEEDLSDDDFLKLQIEEAQIRTINIVEEEIMMKEAISESIEEMNEKILENYMEQERMTWQIVETAVEEMSQKAIETYQKQEKKMMKQLVQATISQMNEEILCKWNKSEEQLIEEEVVGYMDSLNSSWSEIVVPQSRNISTQTENEETVDIEEMVDAKIRTMIPEIIRRASKVIEGKYTVLQCPYCQNSQMERLINVELLKKLKKRKTE